jgi:hypothetical protein
MQCDPTGPGSSTDRERPDCILSAGDAPSIAVCYLVRPGKWQSQASRSESRKVTRRLPAAVFWSKLFAIRCNDRFPRATGPMFPWKRDESHADAFRPLSLVPRDFPEHSRLLNRHAQRRSTSLSEHSRYTEVAPRTGRLRRTIFTHSSHV